MTVYLKGIGSLINVNENCEMAQNVYINAKYLLLAQIF